MGHSPQTVSISCLGSWHSTLNGVTEQHLFTNTVVQAFTALLNHLIPEQKTFSDHKSIRQQRLKSANSHPGTKVFIPQFTDTTNKLSLMENWMLDKLVLTEMPNFTLSRKIQSLWEIRNYMKAKMQQKKTPNLWEYQKSKNKRQSEAPDKLNYVRVHPTYSRSHKMKGCGAGRGRKEPDIPSSFEFCYQTVTLYPTQLI